MSTDSKKTTTAKEQTENRQPPDSNENTPADFHGAAIIDEQGNELPITEDMVQDACKELDKKPEE